VRVARRQPEENERGAGGREECRVGLQAAVAEPRRCRVRLWEVGEQAVELGARARRNGRVAAHGELGCREAPGGIALPEVAHHALPVGVGDPV
jgi:hypothetical protein